MLSGIGYTLPRALVNLPPHIYCSQRLELVGSTPCRFLPYEDCAQSGVCFSFSKRLHFSAVLLTESRDSLLRILNALKPLPYVSQVRS